MNLKEIIALKGPALHELAAELAIPNRSKMKVGEIRDAIAAHFEAVENTWVQEGINNSIGDPGLLFTQSVSNALGSASPMTPERRMDVYLTKGKVTPKMARRARKAENRARG